MSSRGRKETRGRQSAARGDVDGEGIVSIATWRILNWRYRPLATIQSQREEPGTFEETARGRTHVLLKEAAEVSGGEVVKEKEGKWRRRRRKKMKKGRQAKEERNKRRLENLAVVQDQE